MIEKKTVMERSQGTSAKSMPFASRIGPAAGVRPCRNHCEAEARQEIEADRQNQRVIGSVGDSVVTESVQPTLDAIAGFIAQPVGKAIRSGGGGRERYGGAKSAQQAVAQPILAA
ncbi:MAG: hypothetical protein R2845_03705 [Thermomicrobiales bacterium]